MDQDIFFFSTKGIKPRFIESPTRRYILSSSGFASCISCVPEKIDLWSIGSQLMTWMKGLQIRFPEFCYTLAFAIARGCCHDLILTPVWMCCCSHLTSMRRHGEPAAYWRWHSWHCKLNITEHCTFSVTVSNKAPPISSGWCRWSPGSRRLWPRIGGVEGKILAAMCHVCQRKQMFHTSA